MLKKSTSGILASLRGSTYGTEYDSPLRSLRPCWTAFLSILPVIRHDQPTYDHERCRAKTEFFSKLLDRFFSPLHITHDEQPLSG